MVYMYHSFLIHSSADGHLGCFHVLAIIKQCCDEHWGARVSFRSGFLGVYAQKWDCWVIWQFYFGALLNSRSSISCPVMSDSLQPMDCSLPGSSVYEILHARILEWVAIPFSRRSSWSRDQTQVSCTASRFLTIWATGGAPMGLSFSSVQSLSRVWLFATPWIAALQGSLSITSSWSLPIPMSIESVMPSNHLILCGPLLLLPPIPPSIRVFSNESTLHMRWPKYWSFSFSISPSNEHPGLISFRMDWLDLLAVQGTLTSLLQHHSSKASIFQCSAFFIVQLSHPYMTTGKTIALTRETFVAKVMSLLFNMLSRLIITFLARSKHLLISWVQSHLQWFWSPPK